MELLPPSLLAGHEAFMSGRYRSEEARYRGTRQDGAGAADAGDRLLRLARGARNDLRRRARRALRDPQRRQSRAALRAGRRIPFDLAALEFAVQALKVRHIVVLGHGRCGGIKAALAPGSTPLSPGDFIGKWMSMVEAPAQMVLANGLMTAGERQTALERISIRFSLANLRTFPEIALLEGQGQLSLHGAWFDISTGELWAMDPDTGDFGRPVIDVAMPTG